MAGGGEEPPWSAFTWFVTNQDVPREALLCLGANNVALRIAGGV